MLPRRHRLTNSSGFSACLKNSSRASTPTLKAHVSLTTNGGYGYTTIGHKGITPSEQPATGDNNGPVDHTRGPRVGLIISKKVGNAVTRKRLSRQLRHAIADTLTTVTIPTTADIVIRVFDTAATAHPTQLRHDVTNAITRAYRRACQHAHPGDTEDNSPWPNPHA